MIEIVDKVLAFPATAYILSFGALGALLMLALNSLHRNFDLPERVWGIITLLTGAVGGVLLQSCGLVTLPGKDGIGYILSAFVGACTAAAAAGFSSVDLRATILPKKE